MSDSYKKLTDERARLRAEAREDDMRDLVRRLERADLAFRDKATSAEETSRTEAASRLDAKAQGVRLALSYAREYLR